LSENTRATGASQAFCTPNSDTHTTRLSRVKDWLEESKRLVTEEAGRNACKIQKVSHRLVWDLAETFSRFPSFTQHGAVWAGQATLALQLGVDVRQVRRAIAVLLELKVLSIKRPSRSQRRDTNTMVALLDGKPLFAEVDNDHRPSASAEYRTPASPKYRATASSNSMEQELKKDSSPVGPPGAAQATPRQAEGDALDRMQNTRGEAAASAPASQPSFARLFDDYPHPPGAVENPAYYAHARKAWNKLSTEQKQSAQLTGRKAPGERWLGYWLDDGRETGEFRIAARHTDGARVWVREGHPNLRRGGKITAQMVGAFRQYNTALADNCKPAGCSKANGRRISTSSSAMGEQHERALHHPDPDSAAQHRG